MGLALPVVVAILWLAASGPGERAATSSLGAVASGSPSSSVVPTATTSETTASSAYPNPAEADLLRAVGAEIADHCDRADEDDRPVILIDPETAQEFGITPAERTAEHVGIACEIPSVSAPDTFHLWMTRQIIDFRSVDVPGALILNRAGRDGVPRGDCSDGGPAYDSWELGDVGGWFMCREVFGDAVIEWSYCLLYTSPSPRDRTRSRMPSSA